MGGGSQDGPWHHVHEEVNQVRGGRSCAPFTLSPWPHTRHSKVNELVQKYSKLLRRPIASPSSDRGLEGLAGVQAAKGATPQALTSLLQGTKANV